MRKRIGLVGCGKSKLSRPAPAKDLYIGPLFRLSRAWVERFCDEWGILSAKHGLVMPNQVVEPYDVSMASLDKDYRRQWTLHTNWLLYERFKDLWELVRGPVETVPMEDGHLVEHQPIIGLRGVEFVFLAGEAYASCLSDPFDRAYPATFPLRGMGVGKRLQWLSREVTQPTHVQISMF